MDDYDMDDCDHEFEEVYCPRCNKYAGMVCLYCGDANDGGDHMVSQIEIWCDCTMEELEAFHRNERTDGNKGQ